MQIKATRRGFVGVYSEDRRSEVSRTVEMPNTGQRRVLSGREILEEEWARRRVKVEKARLVIFFGGSAALWNQKSVIRHFACLFISSVSSRKLLISFAVQTVQTPQYYLLK